MLLIFITLKIVHLGTVSERAVKECWISICLILDYLFNVVRILNNAQEN